MSAPDQVAPKDDLISLHLFDYCPDASVYDKGCLTQTSNNQYTPEAICLTLVLDRNKSFHLEVILISVDTGHCLVPCRHQWFDLDRFECNDSTVIFFVSTIFYNFTRSIIVHTDSCVLASNLRLVTRGAVKANIFLLM